MEKLLMKWNIFLQLKKVIMSLLRPMLRLMKMVA